MNGPIIWLCLHNIIYFINVSRLNNLAIDVNTERQLTCLSCRPEHVIEGHRQDEETPNRLPFVSAAGQARIASCALLVVFNWSAICVTHSSRSQLLLATTMCHKQPPDNQSNLDLWLWLCSWPAASRSYSRHFCLIYLPCTLLTVNCHLWRHQTRIQTTPTACVLHFSRLPNAVVVVVVASLCRDLVSSSSCGLALGQTNVTHAKYQSVVQLVWPRWLVQWVIFFFVHCLRLSTGLCMRCQCCPGVMNSLPCSGLVCIVAYVDHMTCAYHLFVMLFGFTRKFNLFADPYLPHMFVYLGQPTWPTSSSFALW